MTIKERPTPPDLQAEIDAVNQISLIPHLLKLLCKCAGMTFAVVARVTNERWIACNVYDEINFGLKAGDELKLDTTICYEIHEHRHPVAINCVADDPAYANHHTPAMYGFQSYISVPVFRCSGELFGTLCAINMQPAEVNNPDTIETFQLYANVIASYLDLQEQLNLSQHRLDQELEAAEMREISIEMLGNELRSPAGAIANSVQKLERMAYGNGGDPFIHIIKQSATTVQQLIDEAFEDLKPGTCYANVGHPDTSLNTVLMRVIDETRLLWPNRLLEVSLQLKHSFYCESRRMSQLFANLLGNAFTLSDPALPVILNAESTIQGFVLNITHTGETLTEEQLETLLNPFSRRESTNPQQALSMSLYIAAEIAQFYNGSLQMKNDQNQSTFTFELPFR
jgi:signal transduction histidine kinase